MPFNASFNLFNAGEKHSSSEFMPDQIDGRTTEVKDALVIKESLSKILFGESNTIPLKEVVPRTNYQHQDEIATIEPKPTEYQPVAIMKSSEQATFISESQAAVQAAFQG
jgi:hypothetical protein